MKNKIVSLVAHTHWDREWYFTLNDSALLSIYNFEKILDLLENNKNFPSFSLDGQTSIIEDVLEYKPEFKDRIIKLVNERRLFIGPWYTQTDSFYVDGESYIRNLYFGIKKANELGGTMKVGYLPDTFGHNIQTPLIFKGFDIDNVIFWRGFDDKKITSPYFNWKALDESNVLGVNLTFGYGAAKWLKDDQKMWDEKTIPMADVISSMTSYKNILLPSGGDQVLIDSQLPETVKNLDAYSNKYKFKISNYEEFISNLKNEIKDLNNLETYVKEFRDPIKARVHRTIGSSRYDIKKFSFELEHKLINVLEPLSIIIFEKIDKNLINNNVLEKAWKLLLDGHAHDSMGACNTDITNENILNRFKKAENLIDGTINIFEKILGTNISNKYNKDLVLYNFDSKEINNVWKEIKIFSNSKNIEIIDDGSTLEKEIIKIKPLSGGKKILVTPKGEKEVELNPYYEIDLRIKINLKSFGYKAFEIKELDGGFDNEFISNNSIENKDLIFKIQNNKVVLKYKKINKEIDNFIYLENVANDGDSYDFSPIKNDNALVDFNISNIKTKDISNDFKQIKFNIDTEIPFELKDRIVRSVKTISQTFKVLVSLNGNKIDFKINTINKAKDHRFRLMIKQFINNTNVTTDVPFGYLDRTLEEIPNNWKEKMIEKPVNYFPIINTFYKQDGSLTQITNTKGLKEIEIVDEETIGLTLYKSDGFLGKDNLEFRPNRASGINNIIVHAPDAQLFNKSLEFELQICFDTSDISHSQIYDIRSEYIDKFDYYQTQNLNLSKDRLERFQLPIDEYNYINDEETLINFRKFKLISSYLSHIDKRPVYRLLNLENEILSYEGKLKTFNFAEEEKNIKEVNKFGLLTLK